MARTSRSLCPCLLFSLAALPALGVARAVSSKAASASGPGADLCPVCDVPADPAELFQRLLAEDNDERRLAGDCDWYCHRWERDALGSILSSVMLLIAVLFDEIFHYFLHQAQSSYVYGNLNSTKEELAVRTKERLNGRPLMESLMQRMGSEFMALGFLAFVVWSSNQMRVFDALATLFEGVENPMHFPQSGVDYLHLAEAMHMQLFMAMLIYFAFCFRAIRGCVCHISYYEQLRNDRVWTRSGTQGNSCDSLDYKLHTPRSLKLTSAQVDRKRRTLQKYWEHFRERALEMVLAWREGDPDGFRDVVEAVNIVVPNEELTLGELQEAFDDYFVFETYLAYSMRLLAEDMIAFSSKTILVVALCKLLLTLVQIVFQWNRLELNRVILPGVTVFTFALWLRLECLSRRLEMGSATGQDPRLIPHEHKYNLQVLCAQIFQGALFFYGYQVADSLVDYNFWEALLDGENHDIRNGVIISVSMAILLYLVWYIVPKAGQLLALPPFFDQYDKRVILRVLHGHFVMNMLHLPTDQVTENAKKDEALQNLSKAVRVLVSGQRDDSGLGGRTAYQEKFVVHDLTRLLTGWKQSLDMEAHENDRDTLVAQRMEDLHRVLDDFTPDINAARKGSQLMRRSLLSVNTRVGNTSSLHRNSMPRASASKEPGQRSHLIGASWLDGSGHLMRRPAVNVQVDQHQNERAMHTELTSNSMDEASVKDVASGGALRQLQPARERLHTHSSGASLLQAGGETEMSSHGLRSHPHSPFAHAPDSPLAGDSDPSSISHQVGTDSAAIYANSMPGKRALPRVIQLD